MGELLNLIGLSTGIALYAMLLAMVIGTRSGRSQGAGLDPLLLATAVLGLVWNVCALPVYELLKVGMAGPFPLLTAVGFSALGLLPAVAVHSVLRRDRERPRDRVSLAIMAVAYAASLSAAMLHVRALAEGETVPSAVGMRLLTYTFIALVLPLAIATRGQRRARRALWAAALSIFAVSALHLSQFHQGEPSWPVELLGHHASLPLAVAILYQDFPFALADLFLKRALALLTVVTAAFLSLAAVGGVASAAAAPLQNARDLGLLVTLWVATALLYSKVRALSSWFVDTVVLRRPDYASLRVALGAVIVAHEEIPRLLDDVCQRLEPALSARAVRWHEIAAALSSGVEHAERSGPNTASVEVPTVDSPRYLIEVWGLTGGRRLLSDDRAFLDVVATLLGRRIDTIRITHERYNREIREQEMAKLATEAELRALRSQINPHFLFNALTTIGFLIQTSPARALETLMRLTALLRGVLRSEGEVTTLGREVDLIEAYLDIERARFEERLRVTIRVPEPLRHLRLPPLLLQPLVENAVKHGIAPERLGGDLLVEARLHEVSGHSDLIITVRDTGAGARATELQHGREERVGLSNIERRLAVQYGAAADLTLRSAPGLGTTATLRIPAEAGDASIPVVAGRVT
jgi:hypothetical protein